jgi:hypothetical protein
MAIAAARTATQHQCAFCRGFGASIWLGIGITLMVRFPITNTPLILIMWWDATEWNNAEGWNAASYLGIIGLILTWFFAFTGGWLFARNWGSKTVLPMA